MEDHRTLLQNPEFTRAFERVVVEPFKRNHMISVRWMTKSIRKEETMSDADMVHYQLRKFADRDHRPNVVMELLKLYVDVPFEIQNHIIYDRERITLLAVTSVTNYLEQIINLTSDHHQYYYRGESNINYSLEPSLFRNANHLKHEDAIYKRALVNFPKELSRCHSHFEKLVRMQHYKIRTRLLDITTNPLVALYFACAGAKQYDISRILLFESDTEPYFPDSDTVSILSSLSFLRYQDKQSLYNMIHHQPKEDWNQQDVVQRLLHEIRYEKPNFLANIKPKTINDIVFVQAALDNDRIMRQSGLFLLVGLFGYHDEQLYEKLQEKMMKKNQKTQVLYIMDNKQEVILEQLRHVNISKLSLFPDMNEAAECIMKQYEELCVW